MDEIATTSMISIAGLDKTELLSRLYYASSDDDWYDADDEIDALVANGLGYVENVERVVFKTDFSASMVNTYHYNKHTGKGALFEKIVADMWARSCKKNK